MLLLGSKRGRTGLISCIRVLCAGSSCLIVLHRHTHTQTHIQSNTILPFQHAGNEKRVSAYITFWCVRIDRTLMIIYIRSDLILSINTSSIHL